MRIYPRKCRVGKKQKKRGEKKKARERGASEKKSVHLSLGGANHKASTHAYLTQFISILFILPFRQFDFEAALTPPASPSSALTGTVQSALLFFVSEKVEDGKRT